MENTTKLHHDVLKDHVRAFPLKQQKTKISYHDEKYQARLDKISSPGKKNLLSALSKAYVLKKAQPPKRPRDPADTGKKPKRPRRYKCTKCGQNHPTHKCTATPAQRKNHQKQLKNRRAKGSTPSDTQAAT